MDAERGEDVMNFARASRGDDVEPADARMLWVEKLWFDIRVVTGGMTLEKKKGVLSHPWIRFPTNRDRRTATSASELTAFALFWYFSVVKICKVCSRGRVRQDTKLPGSGGEGGQSGVVEFDRGPSDRGNRVSMSNVERALEKSECTYRLGPWRTRERE